MCFAISAPSICTDWRIARNKLIVKRTNEVLVKMMMEMMVMMMERSAGKGKRVLKSTVRRQLSTHAQGSIHNTPINQCYTLHTI